MDRNEIVRKVRELFFARENEKAFREISDRLSEELKDSLPLTGKNGTRYDDVVVTLVEATRSQLDMKKLCAFFSVTEKDLEQFKTVSTYKKLTVSRPDSE